MITRNPEAAASRAYDLIIIGGGVYGIMLALEASLRELSVLVIERKDFGGETSFNSLKTIHGGLRALQKLDIKRHREYASEQRWFLDHFPDLVKPLKVLMPLYQQGLRRTSAMQLAFILDAILSRKFRLQETGGGALSSGSVLSDREVKRLFPAVKTRRLKGGALWQDAWMPDTQRVIMEILHAACSLGAVALNYVRVTELLTDRQNVAGVMGRDAITNSDHSFYSPVVVNATGPWSRETARHFDRDLPELFRDSIAWNVLFDREALSECSLAVSPPQAGSRLYFVHSWKGRLLAGTGHATRDKRLDSSEPTSEELDGFLQDLNEAIPSLQIKHRDVLHVYSGYLPVKEDGTLQLRRKACLVDHAKHDGPEGLFSMSGTRFTAARSTAEQVMRHIFTDREVSEEKMAVFRKIRRERYGTTIEIGYRDTPDVLESPWSEYLSRIIEDESVCRLEDLIFRRTLIGDNPVRARTLAPKLCTLFDWDDVTCREEIAEVEKHFERGGQPVGNTN